MINSKIDQLTEEIENINVSLKEKKAALKSLKKDKTAAEKAEAEKKAAEDKARIMDAVAQAMKDGNKTVEEILEYLKS